VRCQVRQTWQHKRHKVLPSRLKSSPYHTVCVIRVSRLGIIYHKVTELYSSPPIGLAKQTNNEASHLPIKFVSHNTTEISQLKLPQSHCATAKQTKLNLTSSSPLLISCGRVQGHRIAQKDDEETKRKFDTKQLNC
jgi:hypothetical protein